MLTADDVLVLALFGGAIALIVVLAVLANHIRRKAGGGPEWTLNVLAHWVKRAVAGADDADDGGGD